MPLMFSEFLNQIQFFSFVIASSMVRSTFSGEFPLNRTGLIKRQTEIGQCTTGLLVYWAGPSYPMARRARAPKHQGPQSAYALFFIS